jgi:outer membrane protein OmpA-like peptidoglycan-associated protein
MSYWKEHSMKMTGSLIIVACAAVLLYGCAATAPSELVDARLAYQHASAGPAEQIVPADLHTAHEALARAEESFAKDGRSYHTRDLAYVAQRKAEMADVLASIAMEQKKQAGSDHAYQVTQGNLLNEKTQDLSQARAALAVSERNGQETAEQLSAEQNARIEAEKQASEAQAAFAKLAATKEDDRGMVITLSGGGLFRSDESTLMPGADSQLDQVANALMVSRSRSVVVEGFTDSQGSDRYNLDLSQRQADAVRTYLVQRGCDSARIQAHGIGDARPVADNATAEGRASNRRVEIVLEHNDSR